jgi:hypothetical protein
MPQGALPSNVAKTPSGVNAPLQLDATGALKVALPETTPVSSKLNLSASTVVKAGPGVLAKVSVTVAGSAAGSVNDCLTTGAAAASNEVGVVPNTVGVYVYDWPCLVGIVYVPGTGQSASVSYE